MFVVYAIIKAAVVVKVILEFIFEKGFEMEKLTMRILVVCLLVAMVGFAGCKKDEPGATVTNALEVEVPVEADSEAVEEVGVEAKKLSDEEILANAMEMLAKMSEQTKCPIMDGNAINKDIFTTYKGKKVYFCCQGCVAKFEADPEVYVGKMPQFQVK